MSRRFAVFTCLVLIALPLGGCTKCGWLWDEGARSCQTAAPRG